MYVYGRNVLKEYLANGQKIKKIYLMDGFNDREVLNLIDKNNLSIVSLPKYKLDKMATGNHQGVVLEIEDFKYASLEEVLENITKKYPLLVMLDHLEDPHNLGAIIRTCEALGVDGIIIPNKRSVSVNSTVIKISAGSISNIPIIEVSNLVNTMNVLKKKGFWFAGTDMVGEDYSSLDYKMPLCLIIGNEGTGISALVHKNCDYIVSIPMQGRVNSLNASVATGIVLSQIVLNRGEELMNYNDYELLTMIKDNNEDAINLLYKKYMPLFEAKAKKYYNYLSKRGYDISDLKQEILIGFDEAIRSYKEDNNVLFYTFLNICLDNKLNTLVRSSNTNKAKVLNTAISLDEPENDLVVNNFVLSTDPAEDMLSKEAREELYDTVMKSLTDFEKDVFNLRLNNLTYLEIADILERKPKDIDNCLSRIKNKIKKIRENM